MSGFRLRVLIGVAIVATVLLLLVIENSRAETPTVQANDAVDVATLPTTTTIAPTTTVMPVPTTVPTTTTTVKRVVTTTTTEPEPQVQGKQAQVDGDDLDEWRAIALCEMPGPGGVPSEPWGAHWTFKGTWSGAFGIANTTWLGAGGGKYGPTAGHATPDQQIEIARVIRDRYGYGAWGCGRKLGLG